MRIDKGKLKFCFLWDNSSLMLIKRDRKDRDGLQDRRKGWNPLQQRFQGDEAVTGVSVMNQLARLQLRDSAGLRNIIFRATNLRKDWHCWRGEIGTVSQCDDLHNNACVSGTFRGK